MRLGEERSEGEERGGGKRSRTWKERRKEEMKDVFVQYRRPDISLLSLAQQN